MPNRWQLFAAVTGSLLLHGWLLFGFMGAGAPAGPVADGRVPIRAHLIVNAPEATQVAEPVAVQVPAKKVELPPRAEPPPLPPPPPSRPATRAQQAAVQASAAPTYRQGAELDPPPRPLEDIDPEYPAAAGLTEGTVVLRLLISASGTVDEVTVIRASPEGLFEASAVAAFGKAKFSPGRYLGLPVQSQITIEVDYTLINRGGEVSGQSGAGIRR